MSLLVKEGEICPYCALKPFLSISPPLPRLQGIEMGLFDDTLFLVLCPSA